MRLSISAKIFLGFAVVLAIFGGVVTYGAFTMRNMADELRLVSHGYSEVRFELVELQTSHKLLVEEMNRGEGREHVPRWVKAAIDDLRRIRLNQQLPAVTNHLAALEQLRSSVEEHALLQQLRTRLERVGEDFRADEALFDLVFGPIGEPPATAEPSEELKSASEHLLSREQQIRREIGSLLSEVRLRAQEAALRMELEESRAVWIALGLAVVAAAVAIMVMLVAIRTLKPLRRLAEHAKEVARGDYRQRVDDSSPDEIGALGREFNGMAAALEEREQRLIRSERLAAVGQIAAQITHEVRNPLSSIGLNAELLEEELADGTANLPEARKLVGSIVKEVDRLTEITEEYLRFARLPRPKLEREDLGAIVTSLLSFMKSELEKRKIVVEVKIDPDLPTVAADENQMRQALLNLLRNAAEAMPSGGRLTLYAARTGSSRAGESSKVELRITDTGMGIEPEHLVRIFDPFFSTKDGGTGLGLALTQQIVLEHGGNIDVASEVGRGTTFTVKLPMLATAT